MAQERIDQQIPDGLANETFNLRMEVPDDGSGFLGIACPQT
jgi:hypothetical protein